MRRPLLLLFLSLAGCTREPTPCSLMEARFLPCANAAAAKSLRLHCEIALAAPAEPPDASPSLAELERRVFVACVPAASCAELTTCLTRHGCSFVLTGPADREPKLWCRGG